MITNNPETEFDRLIQARLRNAQMRGARMDDTHISDAAKPRMSKFHRDNRLPDPIPVSRPVNYGGFFTRAKANSPHEPARSQFTPDPAPPSPANEPAVKRYKYQGKTYKEEPIGKR